MFKRISLLIEYSNLPLSPANTNTIYGLRTSWVYSDYISTRIGQTWLTWTSFLGFPVHREKHICSILINWLIPDKFSFILFYQVAKASDSRLVYPAAVGSITTAAYEFSIPVGPTMCRHAILQLRIKRWSIKNFTH